MNNILQYSINGFWQTIQIEEYLQRARDLALIEMCDGIGEFTRGSCFDKRRTLFKEVKEVKERREEKIQSMSPIRSVYILVARGKVQNDTFNQNQQRWTDDSCQCNILVEHGFNVVH